METYFCSQCEVYALGINVEPQDAICMCGKLMEEE